MKVAISAMGGAQGFYRFGLPLSQMDVPGLEVQPVDDQLLTDLLRSDGGQAPEVDLLALQRPMDHWWPTVIEHAQARGVAVVVDVDDRLGDVHPQNVCYRDLHPRFSPDHNHEHLDRCCELADLVTVSTPPLVDVYGSHGRSVVLRNCVPQRYLDIDVESDDVVGWAGWIGFHPDDLPVVGAAVARITAEGWPFRVIGPGEGVDRALGVRSIESTGWVEFSGFHDHLARLSTAIAPLSDTVFNRAGKSFLRPLEAMAVGVPVVCTDMPEYRVLVDAGAGLAVSNPKDWHHALRLARDSRWQEEQREAGRSVAAQWLIDHHHHRWSEAWSAALATRRSMGGAASRPHAAEINQKPAPVPETPQPTTADAAAIRAALAEHVAVVVGEDRLAPTVDRLPGVGALLAPVAGDAFDLLDRVMDMLVALHDSLAARNPVFLVTDVSIAPELMNRMHGCVEAPVLYVGGALEDLIEPDHRVEESIA